MFSKSIYFFVASLALASSQITLGTELPSLKESSTTVNPEKSFVLPQDETAEEMNHMIDETTEESNAIETTAHPIPAEEPTHDAAPMVPFFSDLAGAFGAHTLLAKRAVPDEEQQIGEYDVRQAFLRLVQYAQGYRLAGALLEGNTPTQECVDSNTHDCNVLASKGYCTISFSHSIRIMMKMCPKTCKFCR